MIKRGDLWLPTRDGDAVAGDIRSGKIAYAKGKRIAGTGVADWLTNIVTNGDFSSGTTGWTTIVGTCASSTDRYVSSPNSLKCTAAGSGAYARRNYTHIVGHKYFMCFRYYVESYTSGSIFLEIGGLFDIISSPTTGAWTYYSFVDDDTMPNNSELGNQYVGALSGTMVAYFDNFMAFDLTYKYGAGNEPSAATVDALLTKYGISYLENTVAYFG